MRSLSPRAEALLKALDATTDLRVRAPGGPSREALLLELGGLGEPEVIHHVVGRLVEASPRELHAAGMALHHLVSQLEPDEVRATDAAARAAWLHATGYRLLQTDVLTRFAELSPSVLALLTCHPSGHVREVALGRLGSRGASEAWPFLLLRLNDWVEQVRRVARVEAEAALARVPLPLLARHLPLLDWLERTGRADHQPFLARVQARLAEPDALDFLEAHLSQLPRPARRRAWSLLWGGQPAGRARLLAHALEDEDVTVRRWAAARAGELPEGEGLQRVLSRMARSRTALVRREAWVLRMRRAPVEAALSLSGRLHGALLDPSRVVRDLAQRRLARDVDVAALYRAAVRAEQALPCALAGLGETGGAADAGLAALLLAHALPSVRREAVVALGRLDAEGAARLLPGLLGDVSPRVSRAAAAALLRAGARLSPDVLRRHLLPPGPPHAAQGVLVLALAQPGWAGLPVLLEAAGSPREEVAKRACAALACWLRGCDRPRARPAPGEVAAARHALERARGLEAGLALALAHLLRAHAGADKEVG